MSPKRPEKKKKNQCETQPVGPALTTHVLGLRDGSPGPRQGGRKQMMHQTRSFPVRGQVATFLVIWPQHSNTDY